MNVMTDTPHPVLTVELFSFSYKRPLPPGLFSHDEGRHGGGFVFDCRCLPNPGREERYKSKTGRDQEVIEYLSQSPAVQKFRDLTFGLVTVAVENYLSRDFQFLTVGYGCTGGQHRSVFFAEQLSHHLATSFDQRVMLRVVHSNLEGLLAS
jgi:RNase adaptor protein for sRNA GlmZ degradation